MQGRWLSDEVGRHDARGTAGNQPNKTGLADNQSRWLRSAAAMFQQQEKQQLMGDRGRREEKS